MRIVISEFMSLDGVVQAPGGVDEDTDGGFAHGGWSMDFFDPEVMGPVMAEGMSKTEALLFGRRTWQVMAGAWPDRAGDPFADQMNAFPKYLASRTLTDEDVHWENTQLLPAADAIGEIRRLKDKDGGDLQVMGSPNLVTQLIAEDLVDEYNLMIEPITLGGGKRIFPDDGRARRLRLVSTKVTSTGVHVCTYEPAATTVSS